MPICENDWNRMNILSLHKKRGKLGQAPRSAPRLSPKIGARTWATRPVPKVPQGVIDQTVP